MHHLHRIAGQRTPDNALSPRYRQPFDGDRPGTRQTGQLLTCRIEQENRRRFGRHVNHDLLDGVGQGLAHRRRTGEILSNRRQQFQIAQRLAMNSEFKRGAGVFDSHSGMLRFGS